MRPGGECGSQALCALTQCGQSTQSSEARRRETRRETQCNAVKPRASIPGPRRRYPEEPRNAHLCRAQCRGPEARQPRCRPHAQWKVRSDEAGGSQAGASQAGATIPRTVRPRQGMERTQCGRGDWVERTQCGQEHAAGRPDTVRHGSSSDAQASWVMQSFWSIMHHKPVFDEIAANSRSDRPRAWVQQ